MEEDGGHDPQARRPHLLSRQRSNPVEFIFQERKAGYSKAKPEGSLRLPTGPWASHVHFPGADNQRLELCEAGFGDRLAPCALSLKWKYATYGQWTWRDSNTLPPACGTGALPDELQAHGRSGEFCHPGLLVPNQALSCLSYTPIGWPVRIELTHRRATTSRLSSWLRPQWSWLALPQPPPAYRAGALLNELQLRRGGEFCHLDLLVPGQALFYLSYTP